jgi:hypothetical protein
MNRTLNRAIAYAVNYHRLDFRLDMADWEIGALLAPQVQAWLNGETDVQIIAAMTPEEREQIVRDQVWP